MGLVLIFTLCAYLHRSFSQSVVQTPPAVTTKECQSLNIDCVFYGGFYRRPLTEGTFFKQRQAGSERERVSAGGRFNVRINKEEKTFSLEIQDVKVEDTATYYCKAEYLYDSATADGSGTEVTVTADSPSLVSRSPAVQSSVTGDTVTFSCEYSGFCRYTVSWYTQSPGGGLKYLLQSDTSGGQNEEIAAGGRISAAVDSSTKISRLKISTIQLSDSAVYYCALGRHTAHTVIENTVRAVQKQNGNCTQNDTEHGDSCKIT
ncbi:uncharacterized protein LOC132206769 [Stegostoma tigrinum]|uniref:uncharacterized protein LOC132206769 n=1 Tax=Stegostoma tigrinum TaxID=3053191 RepID=UPI002870524E|nr:uncharacterized protein LOC132206769 [Stegostoma tigrinum]